MMSHIVKHIVNPAEADLGKENEMNTMIADVLAVGFVRPSAVMSRTNTMGKSLSSPFDDF